MFKIGDFSKMGQVSVKTLRHYARLGLLEPAWIDRFSGYRYYTLDQLARLNRILALKDLGFSLGEIHRLLQEDLSGAELRGMMRARQVELESQIRDEQARLARVETRLRQIEREGALPGYEVAIKPIPAQTVVGLRRVIPSVQSIPDLVNELFVRLPSRIIIPDRSLAIQVLYYGLEYRERDVDVEAALSAELMSPSRVLSNRTTIEKLDLVWHKLPAVETMACAVYQGRYEGLNEAYQALMVWTESNGFRVRGPGREVYLLSQPDRLDRESLVAEVQLPLEKTTMPYYFSQHKEEITMQPKILARPGFTAVGLRYQGKNENNEIAELWGAFNTRIREIEHVVDGAFGICKPADENGAFEYLAAMAVSDVSEMPAGMERWDIPEQQYAVFPCGLPQVGETYRYAFETWLPSSDYEYTNEPDFEYYDEHFDPQNPESLMYVYIPVCERSEKKA